jgi:hypothetical protein
LLTTLSKAAGRPMRPVPQQSSIRSSSSNRSKRFERLEPLERFEPNS